MAAVGNNDPRHLSSAQQRLLRAALASNQPQSTTNPTQSSTDMSATDGGLPAYLAPGQTLQNPALVNDAPNFTFGDSSFNYLDGETSFDFDDTNFDDANADDSDIHDKRKMDDEDDDEEEGDNKRQEGEDKQAKKPGRKPLTSEPTTKRKAQNRAAQRAFRERKEKHLKDLETKVAELTKSSETEKQQNGLLRAQVSRLQTELRDYRKRMAADTSNTRPSSGQWQPPSLQRADFAFEFPVFGQLPKTHLLKDDAQAIKKEGSSSPNGLNSSSRHGSASNPALNNVNGRHNSTNSNPSHSNSVQSFAGLFSPGILNSASAAGSPDYGFPTTASPTAAKDDGTPHSGIARAFRFNSESGTSHTDSPSQSSMSQFNANSSCNTSPAPSHPSPPKDSLPSSANPGLASTDMSSNNSLASPPTLNGIDWLASQNGGQFDPVLFGDYRESQDAIVGDGEFNNGFFNDAFPFDFGSPLNFSDTKSPQPLSSNNIGQKPAPATGVNAAQGTQPASTAAEKSAPCKELLASIEKNAAGGDDSYGLTIGQNTFAPGTTSSMLSANKIWNQLQGNKSFQDGKFDLDGLCSELRTKAKCSESGIVVPQKDVEEAFKRLGDGTVVPRQDHLIFDEALVDEAVNKLGGDKIDWGGFGLNNL